ncbi:unnamed protein product [Owenia fusiformis]|uniref:Uncharacterized protein n=1 Tax=Owenia fusiformis TaxID=6347 RepID=A0A8J1TBS4_OWEFU|nr:unnamed protein product [Owenia fusiformis]
MASPRICESDVDVLTNLAVTKATVAMMMQTAHRQKSLNFLKMWTDKCKLGRLRKISGKHFGNGNFPTNSDPIWSLCNPDIVFAIQLFEIAGFNIEESSMEAIYSGVLGAGLTDSAIVRCKFSHSADTLNAVFELHATWLNADEQHVFEMVFEEGIIVWDLMKPKSDDGCIALYEKASDRIIAAFTFSRNLQVPSCDTGDGVSNIPDFGRVFRLAQRLLSFLKLVDERKQSKDMAVHEDRDEVHDHVAKLTGKPATVHQTAVVDHDVTLGYGTRIWHFSHLSENTTIGNNCNIGANVFTGVGVIVGNNVKIQNNVSVYDGVTIEDYVFLGPSMVFTNDFLPRSDPAIVRPYTPTRVCKGASVGANATIVCGVRLGEYCMVGAGAVVTRDVPDYALVYGNPAKLRGWVNKRGEITNRFPTDESNAHTLNVSSLDCSPVPFDKLEKSPTESCRSKSVSSVNSNISEEDMSWPEEDCTTTKEKNSPQQFPPMFTLASERKEIGEEIANTTRRILQEGKFIQGPEVGELESVLADYVGVEHCITVGNGTDALQVALMALGVTNGDEVIVPSLTFISTAEVVCLLGAIPVFVDITAETFTVNVDLIKDALTSRTKVIIGVSLFGLIADFDNISALLQSTGRQDVTLIEDAAQSFGATKNGRRSGSLTKIACTSFFPTKPLGCYGDGGAIFTSDITLARTMRMIANHGQASLDEHKILGVNSRLDTMQAGIILTKMKTFEKSLQSRRDVAAIYKKYLSDEASVLTLPSPTAENAHVFAMYTMIVGEISRDALRDQLELVGLKTRIYWPKPLHQQDVFDNIACVKMPCPVAEKLSRTIFSISIFPFMTEREAIDVALIIKQSISVVLNGKLQDDDEHKA